MIKKIVLGVVLLSDLAQAELFEKGQSSFAIAVGAGSQSYGRHSENYTIFGVDANYFVIDNLSVGFAYKGWFGGTPSLNQLSVPVNYYIPVTEMFRPYVGLFARNTFVSDGGEDYGSYGFRGGVTMIVSPNTYIGVGLIQEYYSGDIYSESSSTNPEFILGVSF